VYTGDPSLLTIGHYDTTTDTWDELATTINTTNTTACATTPSLSPFALLVASPPLVTLSASSLVFNPQPEGVTSAPQAITLSNTGGTTLAISSIAVTGANSGDFHEADNCVGSVLAGGNCTINVTFTPSAPGTRNGWVTITDNAAGSPQSIALSGTGLTGATALTISAPAITYGSAALVTVSVTSAAGTVSGNVSLTVDSGSPLTQALSSGSTVFTIHGLAGGNHSLSASYAAQGNFLASSSTGTLQVNPAPPTASFTGAPASAPYGSTFTVNATTNASTSAVLSASGACSIAGNTVTMTSGTGKCSLTANWAADNNYNAATASQSTAAVKITPTATFTGAPASAAYESTFTVAATTNASTTAVITAGGACSVAGTLVTMTSGTGTCNLVASWAADSNYLAATLTQTTAAVGVSSTTAITSHLPFSSVTGQGVVVSFTVSPVAPATGTPTGLVTVSDGTGDTCTGAVTGTGQCTLIITTAGSKTLTATYGGNGNFNPSASAGVTQWVGKAFTQTTIVQPQPNLAIVVGQPVKVTFTVTPFPPGGGTPTGNVTVSDFFLNSCTATVAAGSCTLTPAYPGPMLLSALYDGDSNYLPSFSPLLTLNVVDFSITASPSVETLQAGQNTVYQVTLAPLSGFTGTVAVACSGGPPGSTCNVSPAALTVNGFGARGSTATVQIARGTANGSYTLTFTGVYGSGNPFTGGLTHSTTVTLNVGSSREH
jgi:hypothetical protein